MILTPLKKDLTEQLYKQHLDPSQINVINSSNSKIVVKAPAGSGKTKILISAICDYRYNYLNDHICAITFTRAAREEMEQRLKEFNVDNIEISTIHVWARTRLEFFANKYNFILRVLGEQEVLQILTNLIKQGKNKINPSILLNYCMGNKRMDVSERYKATLKRYDEKYQQYKKEHELYDFTDYPKYLLNVLNKYNEQIKDIEALFVDEFQDVDLEQEEVFEKVIAHKKFFIGDSHQCIYSFRGSDERVFEKLEQQNFNFYSLQYNYRSHQEIIDFSNTLYDCVENETDSSVEYNNEINPISYIERNHIFLTSAHIKCNRGFGSNIYIINQYEKLIALGYNDNEILNIKDLINPFLDTKPMILCRTNKEVKMLNELGWIKVSTIHQAKGLEYDNVIVSNFVLKGHEDLNIAYVAFTRAKNDLMLCDFDILYTKIKNYLLMKKSNLLRRGSIADLI